MKENKRDKGRKEWRRGGGERKGKEMSYLFLEDSFSTLAYPLELCYYLYLKLFFGFLKVLLGHGIIFLPHFIHDGTESSGLEQHPPLRLHYCPDEHMGSSLPTG